MARRLSRFVRQHCNDLVDKRIGVWIQRYKYSFANCDIDVHCIDDRRLPHGLCDWLGLLVDQVGVGSTIDRPFRIGRPFEKTIQHPSPVQSNDRRCYLYSRAKVLRLDDFKGWTTWVSVVCCFHLALLACRRGYHLCNCTTVFFLGSQGLGLADCIWLLGDRWSLLVSVDRFSIGLGVTIRLSNEPTNDLDDLLARVGLYDRDEFVLSHVAILGFSIAKAGFVSKSSWIRAVLACALISAGMVYTRCEADDYFITIGGGGEPRSNQASLEANVNFFKDVLQRSIGPRRQHSIFFADGSDSKADVQFELDNDTRSKSMQLLSNLNRLPPANIAYRDHQVTGYEGASRPALIRSRMEQIARKAKAGDRVLIYVTAHGGKGSDKDPFNTTIYCWNKSTISVREFSGWLDQFSVDVPVIMVMAQCYCGGFSHTLFSGGNEEDGPAKHLRVGFFAQQHNLQAAGCRPDVKNDEEFSSYFWGAMVGNSRSGKPMTDADLNKDRQVSFDEAYAHAVITSETIDIPLRSSDVLLRTYSKIPNYTFYAKRAPTNSNRFPPGRTPPSTTNESDTIAATENESPTNQECHTEESVLCMSMTIDELIDKAMPANAQIVKKLCEALDVELDTPAEEIANLLGRRGSGPGFSRQGRRSSGRRELLADIHERWPELAEEDWAKSSLLKSENEAPFLEEVQKLETYEAFELRKKDIEESTAKSKVAEMQRIKARRLLETLECIALAHNLKRTASEEITKLYARMIDVENGCIGTSK